MLYNKASMRHNMHWQKTDPNSYELIYTWPFFKVWPKILPENMKSMIS